MSAFPRHHPKLARLCVAVICVAASAWALSLYGSSDAQAVLAALISLCGPGP